MPTFAVGIFCNVARLRATDSIKIKICKRKAHTYCDFYYKCGAKDLSLRRK
mgnify:CR=1 FL=1